MHYLLQVSPFTAGGSYSENNCQNCAAELLIKAPMITKIKISHSKMSILRKIIFLNMT